MYQVTPRGKGLVDLLEKAVHDYRESFREDFRRSLAELEAQLAAGEIAEEMYFKKRKDIEARYDWVKGG